MRIHVTVLVFVAGILSSSTLSRLVFKTCFSVHVCLSGFNLPQFTFIIIQL